MSEKIYQSEKETLNKAIDLIRKIEKEFGWDDNNFDYNLSNEVDLQITILKEDFKSAIYKSLSAMHNSLSKIDNINALHLAKKIN